MALYYRQHAGKTTVVIFADIYLTIPSNFHTQESSTWPSDMKL